MLSLYGMGCLCVWCDVCVVGMGFVCVFCGGCVVNVYDVWGVWCVCVSYCVVVGVGVCVVCVSWYHVRCLYVV